MLQDAKAKQDIKDGVIMSFFEDGTYTETSGAGKYISGKWNLEGNKVIRLTSPESFNTVTAAFDFENEQKQLELAYNNRILKFAQIHQPLKDYHEDPFYGNNNSWRIKPLTSESTDQIQARLANYIKHLAYILKAADERNESVVYFKFSMGIIKIYNGGIGINSLSEVPATWINTYFDEREAITAYNMFSIYLRSHSYGGAGTGKWIADDYNILLSIYGDAKQGKFTSLSN